MVCGEGLIRESVQLSGARIALDRRVESRGIERLEPGAKPRELAGGEPLNSLLDFFGGDHMPYIASTGGAAKRRIHRD